MLFCDVTQHSSLSAPPKRWSGRKHSAAPLRLGFVLFLSWAACIASINAQTGSSSLDDSDVSKVIVKLKWEGSVPDEARNSVKVYVCPKDVPEYSDYYLATRVAPDVYVQRQPEKGSYKAWAQAPGYRPNAEGSDSINLFHRTARITLEMKRVVRQVAIPASDFPPGSKLWFKRLQPHPDQTEEFLFTPGQSPSPISLPSGTYRVRCEPGNAAVQVVIPDDGPSPDLRFSSDFNRGNVTFNLPPNLHFSLQGHGIEPIEFGNGRRISGLPVGDYILAMIEPGTNWTMPVKVVLGDTSVNFPEDELDKGWVLFRDPVFNPDLVRTIPDIAQHTQLFIRDSKGKVVLPSFLGPRSKAYSLPPGEYTPVIKRKEASDDDKSNFTMPSFTVSVYRETRTEFTTYDDLGGFMLGKVRLKFDSNKGSYKVVPSLVDATGNITSLDPRLIQFVGSVSVEQEFFLPVGHWQLNISRTDSSSGSSSPLSKSIEVIAGREVLLPIQNSVFMLGK